MGICGGGLCNQNIVPSSQIQERTTISPPRVSRGNGDGAATALGQQGQFGVFLPLDPCLSSHSESNKAAPEK